MAFPTLPARLSGRPELLGDVAVAAVALALSLGLLAAGGSDLQQGGRSAGAVGVLLTVLASLPLLARRRAPLAVFVLTAAASVALRAVAEPAGPPVGPTVALYFLAAAPAGRRPQNAVALAIAAVLLAAHALASSLAEHAFPGTALAFGLLVWGGAWLAGERTRLRAEQLAELRERALRAERDARRERRLAAAEERIRIARDLHDSAGHAINVILVHAGLGRMRAPEGSQAAETFGTIEEVARETIADIDGFVAALRDDGAPPVEAPPGLAALDPLIERQRTAGLDVVTTLRGERESVPPAIDRGAYRILQEALTNAARHGSGSATVDIDLGAHELELTVTNPVDAASAARRDGSGGHGLAGMRERAGLLGGTLTGIARDGRFRLHVRLPYATDRP
jgi:signal transduction histidine kinase